MSYYRLFQFGTANHFVSFKLLHPVRSNISIKWEEDIVVNYNLVDGDNKTDRYTQTYALLLVPPEMILPDKYLETEHDFYLRDRRLIVIHWNYGAEWTTFTEVKEESRRLYNEDFPTRTRTSSSLSIHRVFTVDDRRTSEERNQQSSAVVQSEIGRLLSSTPAVFPSSVGPLTVDASASASASASSSNVTAPKRTCPWS